MQLRVLTLNVWNDEGDPRRIGLINRGVRALNPDLAALQEVVGDGAQRQLDALLDGTGLHATHESEVTAWTPPGGERYGGNAVATRWPHRVVEALDLRMRDSLDVPWSTLAASVPLPGEGDLLFIVTTTSWRLAAEAARERQAVALADLDARHRTDLPTIIAGDFSAAPDASSIRFLTGRQSLAGQSVCYHDAWAVAGQGAGYTWTSDNPNARSVIDHIVRQPQHRRRVDYVFVGSWDAHPGAYSRVTAAKLAFDRPEEGIWASDHFGVVVDLDVGKGR